MTKACYQGDPETARPLIEEALASARERDDKVEIAWGITRLGYVAHMAEDYPAARAFFEQSLLLWRELDHTIGQVQSLFHLAMLRQRQGGYAAAYALREELHVLARDFYASSSWAVRAGLAMLGDSAADLGRWEEAAARCAASLRFWPEHQRGDPHHAAWALTAMARVALARGRPARAARLLAASPALLAAGGAPRWPIERNNFERIASAARAQLGEDAFTAAWAEGEARPIEQIIAEALEEAPAG